MGLLDNFLSRKNKYVSVIRDKAGQLFYTLFSTGTKYQEYSKKEAYKTTYALNTVIGIIKNTSKLANINLYHNDKLIQKNFLYSYKQKPNPYQSWTDFIEEYVVWYCLGTAYYYKQSGINEENRNQYWLDPEKFDNKTKQLFHSFGKKLSSQSSNELKTTYSNHIINYQYNDIDMQQIPLKDIVFIHSQPALDSWYNCDSNINALWKLINNSESALDGKNINLYFSQQYLLGQKQGKDDMQQQITGLSKEDRDDIKNKVFSNEKLIVTGKTDLELKRFVEKLKDLGYDESFMKDYLFIGLNFGVPVEVLGDFMASSSLTSQGDAKAKAMVQMIDMCVMPIMQKLTDVLELVQNENQEVKAEFTHLWFMQVVLKEKAEREKIQLESLKIAKELGYNVDNELNNIYG